MPERFVMMVSLGPTVFQPSLYAILGDNLEKEIRKRFDDKTLTFLLEVAQWD